LRRYVTGSTSVFRGSTQSGRTKWHV
jgi:hypothetical protein